MIAKATDKATAIECTHCGLPVPAGLLEPIQKEQFCCNGCRGAWQLIHDCGLESFYRMADSDSDSLSLKERKGNESKFAEFDTDSFLEKFSTSSGDGFQRIKLALDGIHCAACIWLIEKLPIIVDGVTEARVNWSRGTVAIRWSQDQVALSEIAQTLNRLGYSPHPIRANENSKRFQTENRKHLSRLGIAAALAGNNMIISAALHFGMFAHMTSGMTQLMRVSSCFVGLIALLIPGRVFLSSAFHALRTRTPHMDLPIALALLIGTIAGTVNVVRGTGEIYFDSLAVLIFLLLIGRWLQFRQQAKAADAVDMLYRMTPRTVRKIVDGEPMETLIDLIKVGDSLEVRSGELIPADGVIVAGDTLIDESILSGESVEVSRSIDDEVFAGTLNCCSTIVVKAKEIGESTRLSQIAQLVEESGGNRPAMVQWANKIGGYFVVAVMVLAALTFAFWFPTGIETAVDRSIALLIVACPCALALATPLAIAVALGRAANSKLMIKSGDVLQALQKPGMIWLDKTGTITEGNLRVEDWYGDTRVLPSVAALERLSQHPVARALVSYADASSQTFRPGHSERSLLEGDFRLNTGLHNLLNVPVDKSFESTGRGIIGKVVGDEVIVGKLDFLVEANIHPTRRQLRLADRIVSKGFAPCWIGQNGKVVAIAAIGDAIRPEASKAIGVLRERGWNVGILSGDHQRIVQRVAARLDISEDLAIGNASPEDKLKRVEQSSRNGTVVMVGDGVNDSASLAAATVGLAVKGGAEASLAAAPVYLAKPGLMPIVDLFNFSDSTTRVMRRNLGVSLAYNLSFAALAFAGLVIPLIAAILMPISSLTVVSLSLGAGR